MGMGIKCRGCKDDFRDSIVIIGGNVAHYMCVIVHSHVILDWFAKVNSNTSTPPNKSMFSRFVLDFVSLIFPICQLRLYNNVTQLDMFLHFSTFIYLFLGI